MDVFILRYGRKMNLGEVEKLSEEEVDRLPKFVLETLEQGNLAAAATCTV